MTPSELIKLVKALKESGVTHFKHGDLDIVMGAPVIAQAPTPILAEPIPLDAPVEVSPEIKHKVEELSSLLKLSDNDLVDQLFPDNYPEDQEESA